MNELMVTAEHLREARLRHGGYCPRGMRSWFERYGLSMREFLQNGYPVSVIEATGDTLGLQVADIAKEEK